MYKALHCFKYLHEILTLLFAHHKPQISVLRYHLCDKKKVMEDKTLHFHENKHILHG